MRLLPLVPFVAVAMLGAAILALCPYDRYTGLPALAWELQEGQYDRPDKITLDPALKLPRTAMVYRLKRTSVTKEQIRTLASNLGLPGEPGSVHLVGELDYSDMHYGLRIARDGSVGDYRAKHTGEVVRVLDDGEFDYHDPRTDSMDDGPAPSGERSKQIALAFLERTRLLPADAKLAVPWIGGSSTTFSYGDGSRTREVWSSRDVSIDISYPGDPVHHSRAEVQVVKDGRVRYMTLTLPKARPFARYPLKDAQEILMTFRARKAYWETDMMFQHISCEFKSISISYFRNKDDFVIPMYYLTGNVRTRPQWSRRPELCWGRMAAVKSKYLLPPQPWEPEFPPGNTVL